MRLYLCINNFESSDSEVILRNKIALEALQKNTSRDLIVICTGIPIDGFINVNLPRTAKDIGIDRDVPFVKDLLKALYSNSESGSYIGFINRDLIIKPGMFNRVEKIINQGYNSIALMHDGIINTKINNLNEALSESINTESFIGRDGFIFQRELTGHFDNIPDLITGEALWDLYFYEILLRKTNLYDDCVRPTMTRHITHNQRWNDSTRPGYQYNQRLVINDIGDKKISDLSKILTVHQREWEGVVDYSVEEKDLFLPFIDFKTSRKISFYNDRHTGDCILHCHAMRKLLVANPDYSFDFYMDYKDASSVEVSKFIGRFSTRINLNTIQNKPKDAINCWIGTKYFNDNESYKTNEFYVRFYTDLCKLAAIENVIKKPSDMLFDHEDIIRNNRMTELYDYLIINGEPRSQQFDYKEEQFNNYIKNLRDLGYKCITTKKVSNDIPSTIENGLSLLQIGNISLHCNKIISINTAPVHYTFNIWNMMDYREWIVLDKRNTFTFHPNIILVKSLDELTLPSGNKDFILEPGRTINSRPFATG